MTTEFVTREALCQHYNLDAQGLNEILAFGLLSEPGALADGGEGWPAWEVSAAEDRLREHLGIAADGWNYEELAAEVQDGLVSARERRQLRALTAQD